MNKQVSPARVLLIVGAVLGVLFLGYYFFLAPLQAYNRQITQLAGEVGEKQAKVMQLRRARSQFLRWRQQSLPADQYVARGEYGYYLDSLLRSSGAQDIALAQVAGVAQALRGGPGALRKPVYTPVNYSADFKIGLGELGKLLQRFKETPLVHKVTSLKIEPLESTPGGAAAKGGPPGKGNFPGKGGFPGKGRMKGKGPAAKAPRAELKAGVRVHMAVEALVIDGADAVQPTLQPNLIGADGHLVEADVLNALTRGPAWMTLLSHAAATRNYAQIAQKNIFLDARAAALANMANRTVSVAPYMYLTVIELVGKGHEAVLRDRWNNNKESRLHESGKGSSFRVVDSNDKEQFTAEVLRIDPRDVYFAVDYGLGPRVYELHVGQNLAESLRRPMPNYRAQALGLMEPDEGDDGF